MAGIKHPSYITSSGGKMGDLVFYSIRDRQYARLYVKPANPDTSEQRFIRKTFGDAVRTWQKLTHEEKRKYNKKALRLSMTGYNLYISIFMRDNLASHSVNLEKYNTATLPAHMENFSVPAPFFLAGSGYIRFKQNIYCSDPG